MGTYRISLSICSVILYLSVLWTPAYSNDKCELSCKGSNGPSFLQGKVYNYGVDGIVSIYLSGADKQETSVKISGQVSVSPNDNCELSLMVKSLTISGPDGKKYPAPKGIEKVVRFSLQDGRVGPEICAEEVDSRASLNIKRAIISLLQTEQKSSTQVDVFGSCPTDVSSSKEGASVLLHRTRDLSRCAYREQSKNDLITAVYNPSSEIKSTQLLQSTLNVESKVNNGVPEKISAVEQYLYKPFSVGDNGAKAEVNTKLTLSGTYAGGIAGICNTRRSIIFENPHQGKAEHSDARNVLNAVKETCKNLGSEAGFKSAGAFAQLVRIFRSANKEDLLQVFAQVKGNSLEKRVFLDALLRAGTGYSIDASIQILKKKELSPLEEKVIFLSLGNARHVTSDAIKAAADLLDHAHLPNGVYLGVGALAGVYCRDHNCHSDPSAGISELSKKFAAKLGNCKPKSKDEEDHVVAVLKGIRNIRHLENNLVDKLAACASDNNVKARVRVSALEAFSADPCAAKLKKTALDIMKNRNLDSEIRIKAYLAVIDCPCGKSANEIKHLLETEPVHQVGRFITTSLRHIRSSANPDKLLARQHYGLISTPNKFKVDDRKFSFYRELSYNVDAIGVGGNMEQTVIYSQDSFLPRSASLNLTAEVFGHNVNILEVGGRQGNLDRVIEHFLGPRSFLRTQEPQEIYDNLKKKIEESYHKVEGSVRGRRSIKSEVDNFDKHVKAESMQYNNELDLDIYIKLFGTDAVFLSLGDDKGFDFNKFLDASLSWVNGGFNKMKHFQQELRGHFLFMDTELAYPTSTGLPLKLDAVGAATGRLDVSSAVDIRQCIRNPESAKVDIKLVPSSDVEIALIMLVDADAVSTGLKVMTNLHSSTGSHVIAKIIENGKGFDLQWGLPIDKQEIVTASSDVVFVTAEKGQLEKEKACVNKGEKKEYSGCFDQLSGVLGLTLCGKVSYAPFPGALPLLGSSKVKLVLEKNDLKGYHIKGVVRSDPKGRYGLGLLFDAEGSQNRRTQINADAIYNAEEKSVNIELESPIKTIVAKYSLVTKSNEYALMALMKLDQNKYYGRIGVDIQGNAQRSVWKPVIEYEMPGQNEKKSLKVDGQIVKESNGPSVKYTLENVKVFLSEQNEMNIEGHLNQDPKGVEMDLKGRLGAQNILLSGSLKGYDVKLELQNTLNPFVNFKLNGHFENTESMIHNDIDLYYGGDLRDQRNRVIFNQLYKRHQSADGFNVMTKNKFELCALPIKVNLDLEMDPKKFDLEMGGVYFEKKANLDLEARTQIKKVGDYSVKFNLDLDKQSVEALMKRDIVSADKSNLENYIEFKNFFKYELSGVVLHRMKTNNVNVGAIGHLKVSGGGKEEDIKFDVGAVENANLYSSHATISNSKGQLLDFLLKINCGANANGQLKFNLKDAVTANGQYQVTDKDGKGNGNIMVHFKKVDNIIKGDVKFQVKEPIYNADIDLYLDFDKNKNDKLHFSTNSKISEKQWNSNNKFEYSGRGFEVNVVRDGAIYGVGKGQFSLKLVLPDKRCITLKADRELSLKNDVYNGHAEAVLSDAPNGQPGSSIKYQAKLVNTDFDKFSIDYDGQLEMVLNDGKNLVNSFSFKNVPKGDKYDIAFRSEVSGNMMPKKLLIDAGSVYTWELLNTDDTYRVKASYGDDIGFELNGVNQIIVPDKGDKKYVDDYTVNIRLPFEKAHDMKWVSTFMYLQPENKAVEVTLIEVFQVNADVYKLESSGKYGPKSGNTKLKFIVPHYDPVILDSDYKINESKEKSTADIDLKAQYGKGKVSNYKIYGSSSPREVELKFASNCPSSEMAKKIDLFLQAKSPSPDTYSAVISVDADGRSYRSESYVVYSNTQPVVDIKYTSPSNPKTSRIYFKGISIRSKEGRLEMKIENIKDFNLDSTLEANLEKDLYVKFIGNSEKLGLKNYKIDISSKDSGSGKRLEFHAINDNKNVLSGSTSYISKQEGQKTIIEGSGTVKIKDEQKPANFKYIRTILTEGNEQGIETFINLAFGDRNHVVETRITNIEYKTSYVYCEEKKQCAHAELNSKFVAGPGALKHLFNVGLDLRKLGLATEFGLQIANEFSEKKLPQYNLNLHVNKENDKYHFHVYSQPEPGRFPAGIVLTFPQRVIALESLIRYPSDKSLPFPVSGELCLYPDKNKPQTKTAARFSFDVQGNYNEQGEIVSLIGFSHPRLGKEALIKFRGSMKRPAENSLKIETSSVVSCSILGSDREAKFYLEVNPVHIKLMLDTPLVKVIDLEGSATVKENLQQADLRFSLLQGKPVTVYAVVKDFEYYEFTTGYSDESERKLSIVSHLNPEKRVDISVDIVVPGQKKNIVKGALYLQDNLVKSDYGLSQDNFNYFVNALKKDLANLKSRIQGIGDKANEDFKKILKKVEPTYREIEQQYKQDVEKMIKEIENDKSLKEIMESLHVIVKLVAKMIDDTITVFKPLVDKVVETITGISKNIADIYEKQIEPQLKQLSKAVGDLLEEYVSGVIEAAAHFSAIIIDFFERHKPELQELANIFTEIFKDITRIIVAQLKEWRAKSSQFFSELSQQLKEMPILNIITEKWKELEVPVKMVNILHGVHGTVRSVLPTEEMRQFLDALLKYAEKKINNQPCNESAELRAIFDKFVSAVTSLVNFVRGHLGQVGLQQYIDITDARMWGSSPVSIPSFRGSAALSVLSQVLRGDIPDPWTLFKTYRPRSLNPLDEVPSKMRAVVVNGQHIFTFDGRHLTFPGSCRYVLAHDHVDRNFTLLIQLANGSPKALILEDKHGMTIELKENGQVAVNGAAHGYPVIEKEVFAFRQANGRIGMGSLYGLMAFCTSKLEVCYIEVSGFYLGKLRGLLGDGNNEPYDDFRLPNGKIAHSESEFGNAYKMASSCPAAKCPEHSHHQMHEALPPACEEVFGGLSPLRPLSLMLDIAPFRQACIHAVQGASDPMAQACDLGRGYAALALTGLLPAVLPSACVSCMDSGVRKEVGDIYEVKIPEKQADIIVTVEVTKSNENNYKDIVVPLVGHIIEGLKAKRITDVKVYLVGITSKMPYPILYDTDMKLKTAKVEFDDESRYNDIKPIRVHHDQVDKAVDQLVSLLNMIKNKLGITNVMASYQSIFDLPLRPTAVKHYISSVGDKCLPQDFLLTVLRSVVYEEMFENIGLTHSLVANTPDLKIGGGKSVNQVVGFSEHSVLLLGDKKQKDTESLRETLELENEDGCVDFAQETGGYTFSASTFRACNPGQQKQWLQTAAASVISRLTQQNLVQTCTCTYSDPFRVRSVCVTKDRKEAARRRK